MFTGLIESIGRVRRVVPARGATRLAIDTGASVAAWKDGESVSVDGACLTVARLSGTIFESDVVAETLKRTTLSTLRAGDAVHLERSLAVGDRLGGHLVAGHVDAVAKLLSLTKRGGDVKLTVSLPATLRGLVAPKGSIALHGVSLTVVTASATRFTVALIPETLSRTKLGSFAPGDGINVEADLIARYLEALMRGRRR